MTVKRKIGIAILLLIAALAIFFLVQYLKAGKDKHGTFLIPRLEHSAFIIKKIEPERITMDMKMLIDNPSPIGFVIDSFSYQFYIANYRVSGSTYTKAIDLEGMDSSYIRMPVFIYQDSLLFVLDSLENAGLDSTEYRVEGKFFANIPLIKEREFEYSYDFKAPAFKIPQVKITDWEVQSINMGDVGMNFTMRIINLNAFPFKFKDLKYEITLQKDNGVFKGEKMGNLNIPQKDSVDLVLPLNIDLDEFGGAFIDYLTATDERTFSFYIQMKLYSEKDAIEDSPVEIYGQGSLQEAGETLTDPKSRKE